MKTLLFDLDGTLLSMDGPTFEKTYLGSLINYYAEVQDPKEMARALGRSIQEMIASEDLSKTNESAFFESFSKYVDHEVYDFVKSTMDDYYSNYFDVVKSITSYSPKLVQVIRNLRSKGHKVILATNPILPKIATDKRINWAGFELSDFDHITRFEEYTTSKPSLKYYEQIVEKCHLDPKECIMIGNDIQEDGPAKDLGMDLWIIENDLIDRGSGGSFDWIGTRESIIEKLEKLI